jgi:hypothetical protein
MGTSVQMIAKHFGHTTPVKNAKRILQGLPGSEPITSVPKTPAGETRVNADDTKPGASAGKAARKRKRSPEPET